MGACYSNPTGLRVGKGITSNTADTPAEGSSKHKKKNQSELRSSECESSNSKAAQKQFFSGGRVHDLEANDLNMFNKERRRIPVLKSDFQNVKSLSGKSNKFSPVKEVGKSKEVSSPRNNSINNTTYKSAIISPKKYEQGNIKSISNGATGTKHGDFLIDDEIADQPELVLNSTDKPVLTIKNSLSELEDLKIRQYVKTVSSSTNSSTAATSTKPSATFRRPKPLSFVESPDGSFGLDSPSYRSAYQDLIGVKTLLFRLQGILQNAETSNPFEPSLSQKFADAPSENDENNFSQENSDLKRQIALMRQQLDDKDRTIRLLQQQMQKYLHLNGVSDTEGKKEYSNAASQTERCSNSKGIDPRYVSNGSNGRLFSMCCTHDMVRFDCDGALANETDC